MSFVLTSFGRAILPLGMYAYHLLIWYVSVNLSTVTISYYLLGGSKAWSAKLLALASNYLFPPSSSVSGFVLDIRCRRKDLHGVEIYHVQHSSGMDNRSNRRFLCLVSGPHGREKVLMCGFVSAYDLDGLIIRYGSWWTNGMAHHPSYPLDYSIGKTRNTYQPMHYKRCIGRHCSAVWYEQYSSIKSVMPSILWHRTRSHNGIWIFILCDIGL